VSDLGGCLAIRLDLLSGKTCLLRTAVGHTVPNPNWRQIRPELLDHLRSILCLPALWRAKSQHYCEGFLMVTHELNRSSHRHHIKDRGSGWYQNEVSALGGLEGDVLCKRRGVDDR
jgi:hypothetical protein